MEAGTKSIKEGSLGMATISQIAKYRPVLSADQIKHILILAKRDGTKASLELISSLARIEWQINQGAMSPAYVMAEKPTLVESLGFDEKVIHHIESVVNDETLYGIWLKEPEALLVSQLERVRKYRYENNKMTMDEEKAFETEVLGI